MKDYLTEILARVRTVEERVEFLAQLEEARSGNFLVGTRATDHRKKLEPWISKLPLKEVLSEMAEIGKWPVLRIFVPTSVDGQGIEMVSLWLRKNVDPKALVEIRIDKTNGMGPVFDYRGRIKDYSVKNRLDKYGI